MTKFEIKDLVLNGTKFDETKNIEFTCLVPGRLVAWNKVQGRVSFVCDSTRGWTVRWEVVIQRAGKAICRKMKWSPLFQKIQKKLEREVMFEIGRTNFGEAIDDEIATVVDYTKQLKAAIKKDAAQQVKDLPKPQAEPMRAVADILENVVGLKVITEIPETISGHGVMPQSMEMPEMPEFLKR